MSELITTCSICGESVETKFCLDFEDLLGYGEKKYQQKVGICRKCGFIFTQNPFSPAQLENRYKNMSKFEYDASNYILDNDYKRQSLRQKHFLEENIDFQTVNSILEVGASSGYNLSLYKDQFERVYGIEPSSLNCRLSKQIYGVELFNGMFDEYLNTGRNDTFDVIFLSMVLEHIVDPASFIRSLDKMCNNYMFIEVPTLDLRHREEPMGIFAEEHVNLFTLDSLNQMMIRAGYSLVNVENIFGLKRYLPAGYPAMATLWKKNSGEQEEVYPSPLNLFTAQECLDRFILDSEQGLARLRTIIDQIPNNIRLALWGVGHHGAMLLANTSLKEKNIVRVYDSDTRKHGDFFAGIEISNYLKQDVNEGIVEGILLMTYTAQKAIMRFIKKKD